MVSFPSRIPDLDCQILALLDLFVSFEASICSTVAFPPFWNFDHAVVSVSIDFSIPHSIAYSMTILVLIGTVFVIILRHVPLEDIFKLSACAAASEFFGWGQVRIYVYIPHSKYLVKPHTALCFLAACAAAIGHRIHFFRLYQQHKSESKVKFGQASNCYKTVFEPAKLSYVNKIKESSLPRNLALGTFGELLIVFSTKLKLLYLLYSTIPLNLPSASDKANCLPKTFLGTLNLDDWGIYLPVIWNCIISVTHKLVRKGHTQIWFVKNV